MLANPFAQPAAHWKIEFELPLAAVENAEDGFADLALSVSSFEVNERAKIWHIEILCSAMPDPEEINRRLLLLSALFDFPAPTPRVMRLEPRDWLAAVARGFPPMVIDRFYVHGAHCTDTPPPGLLALQVDAGAAFGSGEHATTRACLRALSWLSKQRDRAKILDMGCGSGILAIAAAKLWKTSVLAADIDPVAVRVTQENARINRAGDSVTALVSNGYASERVRRAGPYDLILSNILARPLVAFAPALGAHLAPGGVAVLSGLLASQEPMVLSAHRAQNLRLIKRFADGDWHTLVIG